MTEQENKIDWEKTTFEGSRREQLRLAKRMTVRQRLEALNELSALSERMRSMSRKYKSPQITPPSVREGKSVYRQDDPLTEIVLEGCRATPLAAYLKALGILRLLSSNYPETRGFWKEDQFVLRSSINRTELIDFFLRRYEPTPVLAPWNGGSGFYFQERKSDERDPATGKKIKLGDFDQETSATKIVEAIHASNSQRLSSFRQAIALGKESVQKAGLITSPDGKQKDEFILSLRAEWPDHLIQGLDSGLSITAKKTEFPPLVGTGWNDGNMDFTSNFMQRLIDVLGTSDSLLPAKSEAWLLGSLFGEVAPNQTKNKIGQFSPGQAGGPNTSNGFDADAAINPWDFVLMIEGALNFASSTSRRNASDPSGVMSFPFTVFSVGAGSGSLVDGEIVEERGARGELWMPLWSQPATATEVQSLIGEGRVAIGRKPARDALDFVRAIHHLGGYRGVKSFQRFGILKRAGKAFFATPLTRVNISDNPKQTLIDELDRDAWLVRFRRFARGKNTPQRLLGLRRQLEDRLFDLSGRDATPAETQSLLVLLGEIQQTLSRSEKAREKTNPVPRLSENWVLSADDGSTEFRVAKAIAGLSGFKNQPLPLRAQLFPVERTSNRWISSKSEEKLRIHTPRKGRLIDTLYALLERRLWLASQLEMKDKPLCSRAGVTLRDMDLFLSDDRMDARIAQLLPGLSLCVIPKDTELKSGPGVLPAAFGLMKLTMTPNRTLIHLDRLSDGMKLPVPSGMLAQLAAGNHGNRAVLGAWRRLRASGLFTPFVSNLPHLGAIDPKRAAAALLIPLRYSATFSLARDLLEPAKQDVSSSQIG